MAASWRFHKGFCCTLCAQLLIVNHSTELKTTVASSRWTWVVRHAGWGSRFGAPRLTHRTCPHVQDNECELRARVGDTMSDFERERWHRATVRQQLKLPAEFRTARDYWEEWETACKLPRLLADDVVRSTSGGGSVQERRVGIFGSSLQSVHVYTLAQVLRRPVLVLGYEDIDTRDSDDSLAGLFLPTRWDPSECFKQPLVLGAMMGHFFAVVPFDTTTHIPLCRADGTPVELRYEEGAALPDGAVVGSKDMPPADMALVER